jgi:hypothetical protein
MGQCTPTGFQAAVSRYVPRRGYGVDGGVADVLTSCRRLPIPTYAYRAYLPTFVCTITYYQNHPHDAPYLRTYLPTISPHSLTYTSNSD